LRVADAVDKAGLERVAAAIERLLAERPEWRGVAGAVGAWLVGAAERAAGDATGAGGGTAVPGAIPAGVSPRAGSPASTTDEPLTSWIVPTGTATTVPFSPAPARVQGPKISPEAAAEALEARLGSGITAPAARLAGGGGPPPAVTDVVQPLAWGQLEARFALKAEACEFAIERENALIAGGSVLAFRDRYQSFLDRARERHTHLWMAASWDERHRPGSLSLAGRAYANLALACRLAREFPDADRPMLEMVAEAQSALRAVLGTLLIEDRDQVEVYGWLRDMTRVTGTYLARHMAMDAMADPAAWADLGVRLEGERLRRQDKDRTRRGKKQALQKVAYHLRLLGKGTPDPSNWSKIGEAIGAFVQSGGAVTAPELAEALRPAVALLDTMAEAPEIDPRLRAALDAARPPEEAEEEAESLASWERNPTPELLRTRRFLKGKTVVLVGGEQRGPAEVALRRAFELRELRWLGLGEHKSLDRFEADIVRPETALVIVMIKFSSHSYKGLKPICERHNKLFVSLTGGYSPTQVAHQFIAQNGQRLDALGVT